MKMFGKLVKLCDFIDRFVIRYIGERLIFAIFGIFFINTAYVVRKLLLRFKHGKV